MIKSDITNTKVGDKVKYYDNHFGCWFVAIVDGFKFDNGTLYLKLRWLENRDNAVTLATGYWVWDDFYLDEDEEDLEKTCENCKYCEGLFNPRCTKNGTGIDNLKNTCENFVKSS